MASHPDWGLHTTGTEVANAFGAEIRGKNVVITGVSPSSIGATTALAVTSQGPAKLILASRTASKLKEVAAEITQKHPAVNLVSVILDLGSVDSVRAAASKILSSLEENQDEASSKLDILINNAGVSNVSRDAITAPDGTILDQQFFVNHLGTFLLTSLLLPALQRAAATSSSRGATRIINVSSHGHRLSAIRFSDLAFQKPLFDESIPERERANKNAPDFLLRMSGDDGTFPGLVAYGQSKCANVLHATELSRRFRPVGIVAFSVHPGSIETELSRSLDPQGREDMLHTAPAHLWKTADEGAATTLVAAFDPALGEVDVGARVGDGDDIVVGYLADCQLRDDLTAPHARDAAAAKRLWEASEKMLGVSTGF